MTFPHGKAGTLLLSIAAAAALTAAPAAASASATKDGSRIVGHVYVTDNTAGTNSIGAFDRHADGTLTPEPGSPFTAGGAGSASGLASQGSLQITANGHYLLAVDSGSNQISVLRIRPDGSLSQVPGGVVSSAGELPVSVAIHRGLVYVANASPADSNLSGYRLGHDGQLTAIPGSTVSLPAGSQPGDVLFNGTGHKLVATLVGTSQIASFTVGWNGLLTAAPGSPFPAQGLGPFGSEFRPGAPNQLFVSNAHNGGTTGTGTVSAFRDSRDGALSSIGDSPFADHQTAPCWVVISPDSRFPFAVNTASGTVSSYSIGWDGSLTLIGSTSVSATRGVGAVDAGLSPDGRFLYLNESKIGSVGIFAVNGGNLAELSSSPVALPTGASPAGMVVS